MALDACRCMPVAYLQFRLCAVTVHGILFGIRMEEFQVYIEYTDTNQIAVRVYMRLGQPNQLCKIV